jgi:hypothetical protein
MNIKRIRIYLGYVFTLRISSFRISSKDVGGSNAALAKLLAEYLAGRTALE